MSLAAKNVSLSYPGRSSLAVGAVVSDIDITIEPGQILAILGPNGAGKSTLIKALARHLRPSLGQITLDGNDIWKMPVQQFARKLAYVPQTLSAPAAMTVHELVSLGRSPHQKIFQLALAESDEQIVQAALVHCGVATLQNKLVSELSGGERQRTIIAMALSQEPAYLLLDEPTASLDFRYQLEHVDLLESLKDQGMGIALILHDLNIAARLADRVALLSAELGQPAKIVAQGDCSAVFQTETLRRVFAVDIEIYSSNSNTKMPDIYMPTRLK